MPSSLGLKDVHLLLKDGAARFERSMVVVVGDKTRTVLDLYTILQRCLGGRPSVLWCYNSELKSSSSRKKLLKKTTGADRMPIRWCYYRDTHRILGQTFGMVILQDFLPSPNVICRTVETAQGGGLIVFMVKSAHSLTCLRGSNLESRFTERFVMSMASCERCLILDDELNVLPLTKGCPLTTKAYRSEELEIAELAKEKGRSRVIEIAKTLDQAHAIHEMVKFTCASDEAQHSGACCCALTAPRGRGKSSALGLALAATVSCCGYRNILVTAPQVGNVQVVFEFAMKGLRRLGFVEHVDYTFLDTCLRFKSSKVRYICTDEAVRIVDMVELVVIDEAAAIPMRKVKAILKRGGRCILSSTVSGYEGTGRSLQLKLLHELEKNNSLTSKISLETPIRYSRGDPVEGWLNKTFCLENSFRRMDTESLTLPSLASCGLFLVDRNALFSYHRKAETFLQKMIGLFTEAHYRNTPNDLQLLGDAPKHCIFVLLEKDALNSKAVPDVLVAIQVAFEGSMTLSKVRSSLANAEQAAGDLIPWTIAQQFSATRFPKLSGARVVRIAARPDLQGMGYGTRAVQALVDFLQSGEPVKAGTPGNVCGRGNDDFDEGCCIDLRSVVSQPKALLPPLLTSTERVESLHLDWVGASFGLSHDLLSFWLRNDFSVVYFRQVQNDVTGQHNVIVLRQVNGSDWLEEIAFDMRRRIIRLLPFSCLNSVATSTCLNLIGAQSRRDREVLPFDISQYLTSEDFARLHQYARGSADHWLVADIMPVLAELMFNRYLDVELSELHSAVLLGLALQRREVDSLASELSLTPSQILTIYAKLSKKIIEKATSMRR